MAELPDFQRKQYDFAAHIRDPENNPAPTGIEQRRLAIYRELFFNNLLKLLSGTFPVLKKLHTRTKWRSMVRQFMVRHHAQTPYFLQIPQEFLAFLQEEYEPEEGDFPFLLELAHYEWAELAMSVSEESNDFASIDVDGDLLDGVPVKSKLAWNLAYQFPVHRISSDFKPLEPSSVPTYLVVYRRESDELGFMELNPVSAKLLDSIGTNESTSGRDLLLSLAAELSYPDPHALVEHGATALQEMHEAEILLGVRRSD